MRVSRHRSTRAVVAVVATLMALSVAFAVPVSAEGGFVEKTVEEIGENTATCDFDRDGLYTDYVVTPEQTVLHNEHAFVDGLGITHVISIGVFDETEYTFEGASPEVFYNTARVVFNARLDGETLLGFRVAASGWQTDVDGNKIGQGAIIADVDVIDGEWNVNLIHQRGPCTIGTVND